MVVSFIILAVAIAIGIFMILNSLKASRTFKAATRLFTYAHEKGVSYTDYETWLVHDRNDHMERLVKWLALSFRVVSYDDDGAERVTWNTPTFPENYPWGEAMPEAIHMRSLFHSVVGPATDDGELSP